jgi:hypothetical protein
LTPPQNDNFCSGGDACNDGQPQTATDSHRQPQTATDSHSMPQTATGKSSQDTDRNFGGQATQCITERKEGSSI